MLRCRAYSYQSSKSRPEKQRLSSSSRKCSMTRVAAVAKVASARVCMPLVTRNTALVLRRAAGRWSVEEPRHWMGSAALTVSSLYRGSEAWEGWVGHG